MDLVLISIGSLIIIGLSVYAGRLLFLLKAQNKRHGAARDKRIVNLTTSIQTIAFAIEQQQCDLSEGAIRICRLLEAMPIDNRPDYSFDYPSIHALFFKVKDYPTHDARMALGKKERRAQDKEREQFESELESSILKEVKLLKQFTV